MILYRDVFTLQYFLQRNIVEVEWIESHVRNIYRAGHKGKVTATHTMSYILV